MLVESASKSGNGTDATERLLLDLARELGVLEFQVRGVQARPFEVSVGTDVIADRANMTRRFAISPAKGQQ